MDEKGVTELNSFLMRYNEGKLGKDVVVKAEKKSLVGGYLYYQLVVEHDLVTYYENFYYETSLEEILDKMNDQIRQTIQYFNTLQSQDYGDRHFDFIFSNILEKETKNSEKYISSNGDIGVLNIKNKLLQHIGEYKKGKESIDFKSLYMYCLETFYRDEKHPLVMVMGV